MMRGRESMVLGRIWRAMAATMVVALLGACGAGSGGSGAGAGGGTGTFAAAKGCKHVGFLLPDSATGSRFVVQDQPLTEAAIKKYLPGVTIDSLNAQNSADTQLTQATTELTKGACILVAVAVDSTSAAAIVQKAKASKVPVIAYDRLIQDNDLAYYLTFDNVAVGRAQGQFIKDHHKMGDNISFINGSMTDNNALLFAQGAHEVLDPLIKSGELKQVYEQYTPMWSPETAQTEMAAALTQNKNNIQIAYMANDAMANTAIAALKTQQLNGKVVVTGQDAETVGVHNVLSGDQSMTVYKPIKNLADSTGKLVAALSAGTDPLVIANQKTTTMGKAVIPSALLPVTSATKENLKDTVFADGYVKKEDVCPGIPAGTAGVC